ncbi:MAG: DUF4139 domain-containing protein [Chitinispirillaceae bacterium]|nr:DUF4139 domain-containing protein [Chitinispirillaceae bacterium]
MTTLKSAVCFGAQMILLCSHVSAETVKSTLTDQTSVEVTVYNSELGLIKDTRNVDLPAGQGNLEFMDVASQIRPVTVHVRPLGAPGDFSILEQNYEYDLISPEKLIEKYVGKKIKLVEWNEFKDRRDAVEAEVLSANNGEIYRIGGEIHVGHPGYKVLPSMPENLIAQPTLSWIFQSKKAQKQTLETSYLTKGISWKADYILISLPDEKSVDLSAWVTIDNRSGATYRNARLKLVAGNVNHREETPLLMQKSRKSRAMSYAEPAFEENPFFEYHGYDLQRPSTIRNNQTKQISLLEAAGVTCVREYTTSGNPGYNTGRFSQNTPVQPVAVNLKFVNSRGNRLGMPLPAGTMRIYAQDTKGRQQFVGEDDINHTPKDENVKLKVGEAFDIVVERRQTDFKERTSALYESAWELRLRNHKEADVTVSCIEPMTGTWEIMNSSQEYTKTDAFTARFDVPVPKNKEVVLTYRVKVGLQ